jgi:putative hydrolase of the HAD superfamily
MTAQFGDVIRRLSQPLATLPTGVEPALHHLGEVQAVLFDIYGTLLISASGDIDTSAAAEQGPAFQAALDSVGCPCPVDGAVAVAALLQEIAAEHETARRAGIEYPEVDIVEIWRRALARIGARGPSGPGGESWGAAEWSPEDLQRVALEYELRVNPVWPMPAAAECLRQLADRGRLLGVISNAQFLTRHLLLSLWDQERSPCLWDDELQYYSYEHGQAKPGRHLYELAAAALLRRGVRPEQVVYVGNDMLKDVAPAQAVGFRTALFAGDARSLRWRSDDPRVAGIAPDLVLTSLSQLPPCVT